MSKDEAQVPDRGEKEPPPVLGTWKHVYIFVICYLACLIAGFYIFSRAFAP